MPPTPIRRALLSVSDKTGLLDFARALHSEFGIELVSTGGTAKHLRDAGLPVKDVSDLTGFPEMMDGRVKTLHPKVHGGLLARRDLPHHTAALADHAIPTIDLLCINLYPFAQTIAQPNCPFDHAIENIDIGGPAMVRSASKNHDFVTVVTAPAQYDVVLAELRASNGSTTLALRRRLAHAAFTHTADYDAAISRWFATQIDTAPELLPQHLHLHLSRVQSLRYGENPHQPAALYVDPSESKQEASVARATQLHGKELSYINLLDADAALAVVKDLNASFHQPAACIVKHATPCGAAIAADLPTAFRRAFDGDPLAAFGGIVALSHNVDLATATAITSIDKLLEVIVAPAFDADALDLLRSRWKNCRLLATGPLGTMDSSQLTHHRIAGGYLLQQRDLLSLEETGWKVASARQPSEAEWRDLRTTWVICKYVKSNAIAIGAGGMLLGAGAGQMDRPSAARLAIAKAAERAKGAVAASDAFFPFPDGPELLLTAGVTAIIHPGGSLNDKLTIDLINQHNAALVLTGQRHFRH
jgi:phosphoribosylaminoimidazolecarboxamide formyltransferase/IMP cyclohydrolase